MADESKKSNPVVDALNHSLDAFDPGVEDGTVLRFQVPVKPREEGDPDALTYAVLWVNGRWYSTGDGRGPIPSQADHDALMKYLVKMKAFNIELAVAWATVR